MKAVVLIIAVGAMCIGPTPVVSAGSHGYMGHDIEIVRGMDEFCHQARVDATALNIPLTGELAALCD